MIFYFFCVAWIIFFRKWFGWNAVLKKWIGWFGFFFAWFAWFAVATTFFLICRRPFFWWTRRLFFTWMRKRFEPSQLELSDKRSVEGFQWLLTCATTKWNTQSKMILIFSIISSPFQKKMKILSFVFNKTQNTFLSSSLSQWQQNLSNYSSFSRSLLLTKQPQHVPLISSNPKNSWFSFYQKFKINKIKWSRSTIHNIIIS